MSRTLVVIGGGIAGVSCVEQLSELCPRENITLITASDVVKATLNFRQFGKTLQEFDVEERSARNLFRDRANVVVSQSQVVAFHPQEHYVVTDSGDKLHYKKLCICSGGRPNIISKHPRVIGIRDTESVQQFKLKLSKARRVVIIGNGGIALELVFELHSCQVLWAIKDEAIGSTFFDRGAATFFLPHLESSVPVAEEKHMSLENNMKRTKYGTATKNYQEDAVYCCPYDTTEAVFGGALGPDWNSGLTLYGAGSQEQAQRQVYVQYNSEVKQLLDPQEFEQSNQKESPVSWACMDSTNSSDWPVYVQFTNGRIYGCDLIVSATGVVPNTQPFISCASFNVAEDGGLIVDSNMLTNIPDVYAAGEIRQKVQEWKPEYSLEQIELVCKDKDAWGPLFNKTSRPRDDDETVESLWSDWDIPRRMMQVALWIKEKNEETGEWESTFWKMLEESKCDDWSFQGHTI